MDQLVAMIFLLTFTSAYSDVRWYVKPVNGSCPQGGAIKCDNITRLAEEWEMASSTNFVFLPGEHRLERNFKFFQLNGIQLISNASLNSNRSSSEVILSTIACDGSGFKFEEIVNLRILDLSFVNCSMNNSFNFSVNESMSVISALFFNEVSSLIISHVMVQNTTGYGIFLNNICGVSHIKNSTFKHCHDSAHYRGGNAALYFKQCKINFNFANITTEDSYGKSKNFTSESDAPSPGLLLYIDCPNISISITRIVVLGNSGYRHNCTFDGDTGGNMFGGNMAVIYKKHAAIRIVGSHFLEGEAFFGGGMFVQYGHKKLVCENVF